MESGFRSHMGFMIYDSVIHLPMVYMMLIVMSPTVLSAGGFMLSDCPSVCAVRLKRLWTSYINRLGEFHQIYSFGAFGDIIRTDFEVKDQICD